MTELTLTFIHTDIHPKYFIEPGLLYDLVRVAYRSRSSTNHIQSLSTENISTVLFPISLHLFIFWHFIILFTFIHFDFHYFESVFLLHKSDMIRLDEDIEVVKNLTYQVPPKMISISSCKKLKMLQMLCTYAR